MRTIEGYGRGDKGLGRGYQQPVRGNKNKKGLRRSEKKTNELLVNIFL